MAEVWLLYREISDQMGTDEVVGVYSTQELAKAGEDQCPTRRTFVKMFRIDPELPLPIKR